MSQMILTSILPSSGDSRIIQIQLNNCSPLRVKRHPHFDNFYQACLSMSFLHESTESLSDELESSIKNDIVKTFEDELEKKLQGTENLCFDPQNLSFTAIIESDDLTVWNSDINIQSSIYLLTFAFLMITF